MATKKMNSRERVLAALNKQPVDRIPYCESYVDMTVGFKTAALMGIQPPAEIMQWIGSMANATDPSAVAEMPQSYEAARGIFKMMGNMDIMISGFLQRDNVQFMNSLMPFENMELYKLNPAQAHLGYSADGVVKTRDDVKNVKFQNIDHLVEDAKEFLKNKGDFAANAELFLGIDPVMHSIGFEDFSVALIDDPIMVKEFMARFSDYASELVEELCKLDFDFIWTFDDIAYHHQTFFSPETYRDVLLPYTRKIAEKITKPWIYHSDGNLEPIWDDLVSQGMNAIHPLEPGSMNLENLRDKYKDRITFVGGVSLVALEGGAPEETSQITKQMIDLFKGKASYMLGASNTVTSNVKPENLKAMLETLRKYGNMDE